MCASLAVTWSLLTGSVTPIRVSHFRGAVHPAGRENGPHFGLLCSEKRRPLNDLRQRGGNRNRENIRETIRPEQGNNRSENSDIRERIQPPPERARHYG